MPGSISKKFDGVLLVRRSATGVNEIRIIASINSPLVGDLDATEREMVRQGLAAIMALPPCVTLWDNGFIGCANFHCVGGCVIDLLVPGDTVGAVKRVRLGTPTVDPTGLTTSAIIQCACP